MAANEKYRMFKNYMLNELGITRDDIHEWVNTSIQEEVSKMVKQSYGKMNIGELIKKEIYRNKSYWNGDDHTLSQDIKSEISKELIKQIGLKFTIECKNL